MANLSSGQGQENLPALIKNITPSVVVIKTYDRRRGKEVSQGSGFFVSETGDLVTNYHVLDETSYANVKTADGRIYPIKKVLSEDKQGDLIGSVSLNGW
jgi:S1-C subfamily serine protease